MNPVDIRSEIPSDILIIYETTKAAFGRRSEADLIDLLRADDALMLSQVAVLNDEIVGHAGYSLATVTDGEIVHRFPALGPIAVAPPHQRKGIGSALVRAGMQAMREMDYGLMFLVGHTSYYPRFGFQPAAPLGFTSDYVKPDGPHEHFMVAVLDERLPGTVGGHVGFHRAFDDV